VEEGAGTARHRRGGVVIRGRSDKGRELQRILASRGQEVVLETSPIEDLVAYAVESRAAVLVMDGHVSGRVLRTITDALTTHREMAVLVVAPLEPRLDILVGVASGISGYLPASTRPEAIADAVEALMAGELILPRVAALPLVTHLHSGGRGITIEDDKGRLVHLTRREWEVLVLLKQDYSTAEIADHLAVSKVTVRSHVAAVVRKLGVPDRTAVSSNGSRATSADGPAPGVTRRTTT
jgi:DNA-binding NarL/FixJ family response regulator